MVVGRIGGGHRGEWSRMRVFVSYARRSGWHLRQVREFCEFLLTLHIDIRFDEFAGLERRDWSVWSIREVLPAGSGDGVPGEAAFLRDRLAYDRATWQRKILPVVLPGGRVDEIPLFLTPYSSTRYEVTAFTPDGAALLLAALGLVTGST